MQSLKAEQHPGPVSGAGRIRNLGSLRYDTVKSTTVSGAAQELRVYAFALPLYTIRVYRIR